MKNTGTLQVATPSDREIVLTRVFDAPRQMVWDAFTKPELLKRWFGPRGWSLVVCEVDLRVGGGFRFVLRGPDGQDMGMRGVYREIAAPERSVHMESFDDYPGESRVTSVMTEQGGKTTLTATVVYESKEVRDAVIQSGMEHGAAESYDKLAEILAPCNPHSMKNTGTMKLTTVSDREILVTRVFDAPRRLVWDAMTKPELVKRWLTGAPGWSMVVCEMDLRVGGAYRWAWRAPDGTDMGMGGVYRELVAPERIVNTQLFDQDWTGGEVIGTMVLSENAGKTTLNNTLIYPSRAARDAVLQTPMEHGMAAGYDQLADMLATMVTRPVDEPAIRGV